MTALRDLQTPRLHWHDTAEALLENIPGVVSATIQGPPDDVAEVRVWYEPTWSVGQVIEAVHDCLTRKAGARLGAARFHAVVANPDRRAGRRPRPGREDAGGPAVWGSEGAILRLVGHKVQEVGPGVVGVEVWIEWDGRTFSGAAMGPDSPPGGLRTAALATLRALHACLQVLHSGPRPPGLVLDSAVQVNVEGTPVAVVSLTASENARPQALTAAWAAQDTPELAVILATLHATARTVTRWLAGEPRGGAPAAQRFSLVDYGVDQAPSGELDVAVRLSGFGQLVDRHRQGLGDERARVRLGASATLDAVHDLLKFGGYGRPDDEGMKHAGACRLRTGDQDLIVVLAEALMDGHRIPLAGAISADAGVERASITAALQATNALVASRTAALGRREAVHMAEA